LIGEGLAAMQERLNPRVVAQKLRSFSSTMPRIDELAGKMPLRPSRTTSGVPA
jgi:flagellar motor component MotA